MILIERLLLCVRFGFLQVGGSEGVFGLRDRQKSGVELDEGGVCGRVGGMAAVAIGRGWNHLGGFFVAEAEEGPVAGEARFIFDVHFNSHGVALVVASLVD